MNYKRNTMKTLKRLSLLAFIFLLSAFSKKEKPGANGYFSHYGVDFNNNSDLRNTAFVTGTNDSLLIQQIDFKLALPLKDESWWLVL